MRRVIGRRASKRCPWEAIEGDLGAPAGRSERSDPAGDGLLVGLEPAARPATTSRAPGRRAPRRGTPRTDRLRRTGRGGRPRRRSPPRCRGRGGSRAAASVGGSRACPALHPVRSRAPRRGGVGARAASGPRSRRRRRRRSGGRPSGRSSRSRPGQLRARAASSRRSAARAGRLPRARLRGRSRLRARGPSPSCRCSRLHRSRCGRRSPPRRP